MTRWWAPVPDADENPHEWPDLVTVAATVLGEAEGETYVGKSAVAHVIMNRVDDVRWPSTPGEVCLQRLQFSCWNEDSPRLHRMFNPQKCVAEAVWNDCFKAAMGALFHLDPDPTSGANHFVAPRSLSKLPSWALEQRRVARIGNHDFYRL